MKKKRIVSITLAILAALISVISVIAGSSYDFGELAGAPPAGQANWTAWINEPKNILLAGMPNEIMTEDSTNADLGINIGYSEYDGLDPNPEWVILVENFTGDSHGDTIEMIFGGLGSTYSGSLWRTSFDWDVYTYFETDHGIVPLSSTVDACPSLVDINVVDSSKTVTFSAVPLAYYHVYKSTQPSGANNGASVGRYLYLMTVQANASGVGTFTDLEPLESWYTVVRAHDSTNSIDGCHMEEAAPTALTMGNLDVSLSGMRTAVNVRWETYSEVGMSGFNVYRSEEPYGFRMMLNNEPIPAENLGLAGDEYLFVDHSVLPGHTYYYWVEEWRSGEVIGPEAVTVGYLFYLPFVLLN